MLLGNRIPSLGNQSPPALQKHSPWCFLIQVSHEAGEGLYNVGAEHRTRKWFLWMWTSANADSMNAVVMENADTTLYPSFTDLRLERAKMTNGHVILLGVLHLGTLDKGS